MFETAKKEKLVVKNWLRFCALVISVVMSNSYATNEFDTTGNVRILGMNIWDSHVDIYLEDGQQHQCAGSLKTRFVLDPQDSPKVSVVLMAFASGKKINLAYSCGPDGYPWVVGIRVKGS